VALFKYEAIFMVLCLRTTSNYISKGRLSRLMAASPASAFAFSFGGQAGAADAAPPLFFARAILCSLREHF
jgi:hypothetical protein